MVLVGSDYVKMELDGGRNCNSKVCRTYMGRGSSFTEGLGCQFITTSFTLSYV